MISFTRQRPPLPRRREIPLLIQPCSAQSAQKCEAFPGSGDAATILHLLSGSGTCPSPEDLTCPIPFHRSFAEVPVTCESNHNRLCRPEQSMQDPVKLSRKSRQAGRLMDRSRSLLWSSYWLHSGPHTGCDLCLAPGTERTWISMFLVLLSLTQCPQTEALLQNSPYYFKTAPPLLVGKESLGLCGFFLSFLNSCISAPGESTGCLITTMRTARYHVHCLSIFLTDLVITDASSRILLSVSSVL